MNGTPQIAAPQDQQVATGESHAASPMTVQLQEHTQEQMRLHKQALEAHYAYMNHSHNQVRDLVQQVTQAQAENGGLNSTISDLKKTASEKDNKINSLTQENAGLKAEKENNLRGIALEKRRKCELFDLLDKERKKHAAKAKTVEVAKRMVGFSSRTTWKTIVETQEELRKAIEESDRIQALP